MTWQPPHFYILLPLLLLSVLLAYLSRRLSQRVYDRALQILTICLLCCESVKLVCAVRTGSPLYMPFHYSTTYYLCLGLYAFGKTRVRHYGTCLLFVGGLILTGTLIVNPVNIVGSLDPRGLITSAYHFYSLLYHVAVFLVFCCMLMRRDYHPTLWDPLLYASFLLPWVALVIPMSRILQFNYAGFLSSYISPLESLRRTSGDACYLIVYIGGVLLLQTIAIYLYRLIDRALERRARVRNADLV